MGEPLGPRHIIVVIVFLFLVALIVFPLAAWLARKRPRRVGLYFAIYSVCGLFLIRVVYLLSLASVGVGDARTYYRTVAELDQSEKPEAKRKLRVGGDVQPGSISKNGGETAFVLKQGELKLNVVYHGADPLPDTFRENAQALVEGRLGSDGVFRATHIQMRCPSKYERKSRAGA